MSVTGQPRSWLRLEGLAILIASVVLYRWQLGSWVTFAVLLLVPDVSLAGYLAGPATGARVYNLAHSYIGPLFLALYSVSIGRNDMVAYALIWTAHIGLDRMLGLGLKYPTGFADTHLGRVGKPS